MTLKELIVEKIKAIGPDEAAKHYSVSLPTLKRWIDPKKPGNPSFEVAEIVFAEYASNQDKQRLEATLEVKNPSWNDLPTSDKDDLGIVAEDTEALEKRLASMAKGSGYKPRPGDRIITDPTDDGFGPASSPHQSLPSAPFTDGLQVMTEEEYRNSMKRGAQPKAAPAQVIAKPVHFEKTEAQLKRDTMILFPAERMISPVVAVGIIARLRDQTRHRLEHVSMHFLPDARNRLTKTFLESDCEWSFWVDSDMIVPCGPNNVNWFLNHTKARKINRDFASLHAIEDMKKRGHKIIGGVYSPRALGKQALIATKEDVSAGPHNRVIPVDWLATGCLLVHRSVYEDVAKASGETDYRGWFDLDRKLTRFGEDVAFCYRAKKVGHQPMLDLSIQCGHVGNYVFLPEDCTISNGVFERTTTIKTTLK